MGFFQSVAKFFQPARYPDKRNVSQDRIPYTLTSYDLAAAELAVIEHENANFQWTAGLFDAIDRDDRVNACFNTRELAVTGLPFEWIPSTHPGDSSRAFRSIKDNWSVLFSQSAQRQVIRTTAIMGFCICSINGWKDQPYLEPWHPRWITYNYTTGGFEAQADWTDKSGMQKSGRIPVQPGDGTWVIFKSRMTRPWMGGLIRVLPQLIVYRQANLIDWGRHGKRHGNPPIVVESTDIRSAKIEDYQRLADSLQELVGDSVIMLPNGAKTSLLELKKDAFKAFVSFGPEFLDQCIAISILGQNLTTSSSGITGGLGSNISATQSKVRQDYIEADASLLSDSSHKQICLPYYLYEHGIRNIHQVPTPHWNSAPPEDARLLAEVATITANAWNSGLEAIALAKKMKYPIDEDQALKMLRMPMKKRE